MHQNDSTEEEISPDKPRQVQDSTDPESRYVKLYTALVKDPAIGLAGAVVYAVLRDIGRSSGRVWASNQYIADRSGMSERSVKRALASLRQREIIKDEYAGNGDKTTRVISFPFLSYLYPSGQNGLSLGPNRGDPRAKLAHQEEEPNVDKEKTDISPESHSLGERKERHHEYWNEDATKLFDMAWALYPKKVDKADAKLAWKNVLGKKILNDPDFRTSFANGLAAWVKYWKEQETELQYVPSFARWIKREKWTETPPKGFVK